MLGDHGWNPTLASPVIELRPPAAARGYGERIDVEREMGVHHVVVVNLNDLGEITVFCEANIVAVCTHR